MKLFTCFLFLPLSIFVLAGCSDDSSDDKRNANNNVNGKASVVEVSGLNQSINYHVTESFNVGNNVVVRALAHDAESKNLWVGTTVGALEIHLPSGAVKRTITRENGLANEYVFTVTVDSQGRSWFGTNGGGVSRLTGKHWKTFFPMHGLGDYWVYSLEEQKDTAMWIGTWAGLSRFDYKTQTFITYVEELVNEWVYGLGVDSKKQLWVGTEGGVNMFDGKTWFTWTHKQGLGAPNKQNLPFSENTGLGTRERHNLSVLDQGRNTYNPNYVFCIQVDKDDRVWAGTWGGGVSFYDGKHWNNLTSADGLAGDIVYSMAVENGRVLWFGTNQGLSRFDGENWQTFTKEEGLLDNHVYAVNVTQDSRVWVGTKHGVAVLERIP